MSFLSPEPQLVGLGDLLVGSFLAAVGVLALLLSVFGRKRVDPLLAAFGAFAFLYGVRLCFQGALVESLGFPAISRAWTVSTATYLINIPAWMFFWQLLGGTRRALLFWWVLTVTGFAVIGILADLVRGTPGTFDHYNNLVVIAGLIVIVMALIGTRRRKTPDLRILVTGLSVFGIMAVNHNLVSLGLLPWNFREETLGFVFFVACLGLIAARRALANERQLASIEGELETARQIQISLLPQAPPEKDVFPIAVRFRPTSAVAGDLYDFLHPGPGRLGLLIADVSGHGVPAALIASMVKVALTSHRDLAERPAELLARVNETLCKNLQKGFVTASYVFADAHNAMLTVANAGHPSPLLVPAAGGELREVGGHGPILGRFETARFEEQRITVASGDRLILYTDGLVEARDKDGEMYGEDRMQACLGRRRPTVESLADGLLEEIEAWAGRGPSATMEDDVTLIVLEVPGKPAVGAS